MFQERVASNSLSLQMTKRQTIIPAFGVYEVLMHVKEVNIHESWIMTYEEIFAS